MKNILYTIYILLLCLIGNTQIITASTPKTFRVYKTGGEINVFFYSSLDSITTKIENDKFVQLFHTPDSIYSIPTEEIDSISFREIPTIYKPGVVNIDEFLREYVIGSDSLTLFLKTNTPKSIIPKSGDNIATLKCDNLLPYGFLGKVINVSQENGKINVECEKPSLLDMFESLSIEVDATSDMTDSTPDSRASIIWPPKRFEITIPSIKRSLDLSNEIKASESCSRTYDMSSYLELNTNKCDVNIAFFITNDGTFKLPQIYFSFTRTDESLLSIGGSFSSSLKWKKEFPIAQLRNIRIPGIASILELFSEAGLFVEIGGDIGLNGSLSLPYTTIMHFTYDNKKPAIIPPMYKIIGHKPINQTTLEGSASVAIGLYGKFGAAPLVKEAANIEAGMNFGVAFSTNISLPTATPLEEINTEMYDELNRDDFYRGDLTLSAGIEAEILGDSKIAGNIEFGDLFKKNPIWERGCVPLFKDVKLEAADKPGQMKASAEISRKLMLPAKVGFAIYDEDDKFVKSWWATDSYNGNENTTISHEFGDLSLNKEYTVYPITQAFNDNMVANPPSSYKLLPKLVTGEAKSITTTTATITGHIDGLTQDMNLEYGILLDGDNYIKSYNISTTGDFFVNITGLQPESEHYFRTYLKTDNGVLTSDVSVGFTTMKESEPDPVNPTNWSEKEKEHNVYVGSASVLITMPNIPYQDKGDDFFYKTKCYFYLDKDMTEPYMKRSEYEETKYPCERNLEDPRRNYSSLNIPYFREEFMERNTTFYYKIIYDRYSSQPNIIATGSFTTYSSAIVTTPDVQIIYQSPSYSIVRFPNVINYISQNDANKYLELNKKDENDSYLVGGISISKNPDMSDSKKILIEGEDLSLQPGIYYYQAFFVDDFSMDEWHNILQEAVKTGSFVFGPENVLYWQIVERCTVRGEIRTLIVVPDEN